MAKRARFDTLRTIAFGSISGTYAAIGAAFTVAPRLICISNNTDAAMIVSDDSTNATGKLYLPAGTFKLFDLTSNMVAEKDDNLELPVGTVMYVKQVSAPSLGNVTVELMYAT